MPDAPAIAAAPAVLEAGHSPWADAWHRLQRNRLAVAGGLVLIVLTLACIIGPWFSAYSYQDQDLALGATPPGAAHWLGTDTLGHDLLVRILYGGRVSIAVGLCAAFVALTIGVCYGSVAGYAGGRTDGVMMRLVDILYALPFTIFAAPGTMEPRTAFRLLAS